MKIDTSKLTNAVKKTDGKIEAQCPACHAAGRDAKGVHLIVYPDGKFGCVAYPQDKDHNKVILDLVGSGKPSAFLPGKVTVRAFKTPRSEAVMLVPRRSLQDLKSKRVEEAEMEAKV